MKLLSVDKSTRDGKKWMATFDNDGRKKTTHFGATGYPDFTLSGDVEAKKLYMQRHKKDLDTGDPTKAGYLSYYLLWNKPTLAGSIRDYKKRFNL